MNAALISLILVLLPIATKCHCTFSPNEFSCDGTNYEQFLYDFYDQLSTNNISSSFSIAITDSNFETIEYFPHLPLTTEHFSIIHLTIKNSSVEIIGNGALEEITDLKYLDLSWNKLTNIIFVQHLPMFITKLYLNNNNITYVDDVFNKFIRLDYLDMSYNTIRIIDMQNVFSIKYLNFSRNEIDIIIPTEYSLKVTDLNLSYNRISVFSEVKLQNSFYYLDLSHNHLKSVELEQGEKSFLDLSANDIVELNVNKAVKINELYLSSINISLDFTMIDIVPKQKLLMNNNKIGILDRSTLNLFNNYQRFRPYRPTIDLSNSSITDISPYYFSEFEMALLNLSNNNISVLKNNIFENSFIRVIDLSNSNIEQIQSSAFKNVASTTIFLNRNKLEFVSNIFNHVEVMELDLSFNKLRTITNHAFNNCRGLFFLNLEHCLIEKIEPEAFLGLKKLKNIILSHNKLFILATNTFNNLPVRLLNLEGNKIHTIRNDAFSNLYNLKTLNLSHLAIHNLEPYAFNNLSELVTIDLTHNNITTIPHYLFVNMNKLKTVYLDENNITTLNQFSNRLKLNKLTLGFRGIFKSGQILNLNIKYLHFKNAKITILKNNSFAGLYNLIELHFNNSYVYMDTGALNNLFNLKYLDSKSLFKHMRSIKQYTFKDLRSLESLDLSELSIQYLEAKSFVGMINLKTLLLHGNNLIILQNDTFAGLSSLKILNLSRCNIHTCNEQSFAGLNSLEVLHLEDNNLLAIHSEYPFGNLKALKDLHLQNNNISTLHGKSLLSLTSLQSLYLQNNSLEEIPIGVFQYLPTLKILNLSNNVIKVLKTGALSNLQSLEVLNLSENQLVNLEYVDIFFSLKQLEVVQFDKNYLKQFDFRRFLINLRNIKYVGISYNKWKCDTLSHIIESFNNRSIDYTPEVPAFDDDNIDGVGCVDMCKFLFCSHENMEQNLLNY